MNHIKNIIFDEEKEINFIKKFFEKNSKILLNRIKKDIKNAHQYSLSKIITSILSDVDNLEKSLELSKTTLGFEEIFLELKKILNSILNLLYTTHVSTINDKYVLFNPNIHQAIALSNSKQVKSNYILNVMQKGYILHQRLLRPAMVVVEK
ncbi:nucleotide exchange factor GrpE [Buchnera aphidicola]|uniref:nucleotide exchange factor GrpE n=1 Tax=Buchnera aphidicola TaxID=9 RepID=UPI003463E4D2